MEGYGRKATLLGMILSLFIILVSLYSLSHGAYSVPLKDVIDALLGKGDETSRLVVWDNRLPRIVAGLLVGASLSVAGAVLQGFLRNPLASPFTMGISHGAMFGASLAIMLGSGYSESTGRVILNNPYAVAFFAFLGALTAAGVVLVIAKIKGLSPEAIILAGVAMSSFFGAATTIIHYFADELQLMAMVYWSFGDLSRPLWKENAIMAAVFFPVFTYFLLRSWDLNASILGDEVAKSVGVDVSRVRLVSVFLASLLTSVTVAFVGVIGFIGLIAPHTVRLLVGGNYRYLIPLSAITGAFILLLSDTIARLAFGSISLPVGVITSFLGVPFFIYLLVKMEGKL